MTDCPNCGGTGKKPIPKEYMNENSPVPCSCGYCNGTGVETYTILNAFSVGETIYVDCPVCADFHKIKRIPGKHKCKRKQEQNKTYIAAGTTGHTGIKRKKSKLSTTELTYLLIALFAHSLIITK